MRVQTSVVLSIVFCHILLIGWGAYRHSPTIDEPAYLVSGLSHWKFGRFDLCKVSPPLVRLLAAIPVLFASPKLDWKDYVVGPGIRAEHKIGQRFKSTNGSRIFWLFTLGRWACLPLSVVGAYVIYCWSGELFGKRAATPAIIIWCFSPSILAHAQLLTPDIGVTSLSLASCYAFWKWSSRPTWPTTLLCGCLLGCAVLAKTNAVALFPALLIVLCTHVMFNRALRSKRTFLQLFAALIISTYVINLGYGFEGSLKPIREFEFVSETFNRFKSICPACIWVPLPSAFVEGIDLQRVDFENTRGDIRTYFCGQRFNHGWWWWYIYVTLVKLPLATWILVAIGAIVWHARGMPKQTLSMLCVVIPGLALFALPSSQTGFGGGLRYVLPSLPFAFIVASGAFVSTRKFVRWISCMALTWLVMSSLFVYPHCFSYFNEMAGGPRNGSAHLLDADFDWGQDLIFVAEWIRTHPNDRPLHIIYWSLPNAYPDDLGLEFGESLIVDNDVRPDTHGWYLVSANSLRDKRHSSTLNLDRFLHAIPVDRIGYTAYVFKNP